MQKSFFRFVLPRKTYQLHNMQFITHILEQLHSEAVFGGGGKALEMINNPRKPEKNITPNRRLYFKNFNYRFKD